MKVGYVVLYVNDAEACRRFWVEQVGMVQKKRDEMGDFTIAQVGFADQPFAFELVPLAMMQDNPDNLDLATPSIAFQVDDLDAARAELVGRGVQATEVGDHQGTPELRVLGSGRSLVRGHAVSARGSARAPDRSAQPSAARRSRSSSRRRRLLGRPSPRTSVIPGPDPGTTGGLWST